jgi:MacB-like periplasmic core domain
MPQLLTRINGRPAMGELVTGNYFSLLGVPAFRGRMLGPSDSEAPGREPVVVLSHAAWMRLFGGDPAAVSHQLRIRGVYVEIVGNAFEGFVVETHLKPYVEGRISAQTAFRGLIESIPE